MSDVTAPRYETWGEFYRAQLKHGPDSKILELSRDYWVNWVTAGYEGGWSRMLQEETEPGMIRLLARGVALTTAMAVAHPDLEGTDRARGVAGRYRDAAGLAIDSYKLDPALKIEDLPVPTYLNIPPEELREVGRLAVQTFKVFEAVAATGIVPEDL